MTWRIDGPEGNESAKIKWELVPYTKGRGLDLGCGPYKTFPHFIGVDNGGHDRDFGWKNNANVLVETCEKLDIFGSATMDFVFSSHLLEHIQDYKKALREWWRLIKPSGYLCLYLPHKDFYPNIGEEGANPDHKHDFSPQDIIDAMQEIGVWDLVENQERQDGNEYSFFQVYQKKFTVKDGKKFSYSYKNKPEKSCGIVRYGAFGDMIMASSVFPELKKQGYHITLYTTAQGYAVAKHDPHIDKIILQDTDQVPNPELGEFWKYLKSKYDKFINLSESVEGTLLALPGRIQHAWPKSMRNKYLGSVNYLDFHHDIAELPRNIKQAFYPTSEERARAEKERAEMGKDSFVIMWSLSGSAVHKTWPWLDQVIARLMVSHRKVKVLLVGDELCQMLECGWENEPRVIRKSGKWSIRESLTFVEYADMIVGPETGVLNAAGLLPVPKVITLSHSTKENLTKHWKNTTALEPKTECYPCNQLHYSFEHCKRSDVSGVSQCQTDIGPDEMYEAINYWIKKTWQQAA